MAKKIAIIGGALIVIALAVLFYKNVFIEKAPNFEDRKFATVLHTIEKGDNFIKVSSDLKQKDLINSSFFLESYFLLSGRWSNIKAGTYDLPYGSTTAQLAGIISRGETKKEKITILEGWNLRDIAQYCEEKGFFTQEEFFVATNNPLTGTFNDNGLEGYLFPDTYKVDYPVTPEKVIRMALNNFQKKVSIDLQKNNFRETIIMASLLEKEVRSYEDKQIVAGILWKRLKQGWPLQVDATINYAIGDSGAKLSLDDLQLESAYNTYRNKGLPPGPICNPGIESIKAAVYYQNSPYWYYLSAKNGKTIFSETFNQHVAAKAKYLR
ncbi:MAG: endolytic transglycosylase MltG [Candidatus Staskawiczbacteria bacterium]|nr:endolytic transglycosylase MltG [Candidatus Staskawiczbacteria bacterium]